MNRATALRGLPLCLLVLLVAAPGAEATKRKVPFGFVGVTYDREIARAPAAAQVAQWERMAANGVESVRVAFDWSRAQPTKAGRFDFSETDLLVEQASRRHIQLLPTVLYAPRWARRYPGRGASPPRRVWDYDAYLRALICRYGPRGYYWRQHREVPRQPLRTWQIWNEPDLSYQWDGPSWERNYGALLRSAYRTAHRADRGARVVLAGLPNKTWVGLERLYRRGHIHGYFDVAAFHVYTSTPTYAVLLARYARMVMRRYGDARVPAWFTEIGLPAARGRSSSTSNRTLQTTDLGMARFLRGIYLRLARDIRLPSIRITRVYWYTWASPYSGEDIYRYSGLLRYDGLRPPTGRLALGYLRSTARRLEGCAKRIDGRCR